MRLIDADKLKVEIEELIRVRYEWISDSRAEIRGLDVALCALEDMPTVDAVPVVRCKDCKYCSVVDKQADGDVPVYVCVDMDCGVEAHGFCAWGDRRDEDETN